MPFSSSEISSEIVCSVSSFVDGISVLSSFTTVSYTHLDVYKRQVFAYFKTLQSLYLIYVMSWTRTAIAGNIYLAYHYKMWIRDR